MVLLMGVIAYGCKDDSSSTSNEVTGTLRGYVALFNEHGRYESNFGGVLIQCEGLPYSTISDSTGKWELTNLPTRTYSISFSKAGYITYKRTSYGFIAGGIVEMSGASVLNKPIDFTIILDAVTMPSPDTPGVTQVPHSGLAYCHTSMNTPGNHARIQYAILSGHTPNIDINDPSTYIYIGSGGEFYNTSINDSSANFQSILYYQYMNGYKPGETVYFRAFPFLILTTYHDVKTGTDIIDGYGQGSNVLSAVMQ
ncbi:MAG TPA: carboxypeptidase-like regulatory domain-containing protein [Candidatus Kapabacteria bacterium]|nr:carboxypeptidase-like regulatory domain-containing protein [Candidatus Kapabacteria bacterium]